MIVEGSGITLSSKQGHTSLTRPTHMMSLLEEVFGVECHLQEESPFILGRMPLEFGLEGYPLIKYMVYIRATPYFPV